MTALQAIVDPFPKPGMTISDGLSRDLGLSPFTSSLDQGGAPFGKDYPTDELIQLRNRTPEEGISPERERSLLFAIHSQSQDWVVGMSARVRAHDSGERKDGIHAHTERIDELEEQARPYGYSLNIGSKATFARFLEQPHEVQRPGLVLMENGNLRAVWKGEKDLQIGLQFLDNGNVQYVIFRKRDDSNKVSRAYGQDSLKGIRMQIEAFDLTELVYRR